MESDRTLNEHKFMRKNLPDDYGLLDVQDKILEIMVYLDEFCRENGIDYCLMGGSALGAKRHGGFIPWDDDLDIFMTPDNYEKFRYCFNKHGDSEKFYLQQWGLSDGMITIAKIRMNGTSYLESEIADWDIHHGIYVDIFILHTSPNQKIKQLHQCFWAKYVITKGLSLREKSRHKGVKGFLIKVARLFPNRFMVTYGLRQIYKYRYKKTAYYCNFLGKAVFKKSIYMREWFDNLQNAEFETVRLLVPGKLEEFLSERFGDYMEIPSAEQIKYEQHAMGWDFNVQKKISDEYKDEEKLI